MYVSKYVRMYKLMEIKNHYAPATKEKHENACTLVKKKKKQAREKNAKI
jgi:hypothetical protein